MLNGVEVSRLGHTWLVGVSNLPLQTRSWVVCFESPAENPVFDIGKYQMKIK